MVGSAVLGDMVVRLAVIGCPVVGANEVGRKVSVNAGVGEFVLVSNVVPLVGLLVIGGAVSDVRGVGESVVGETVVGFIVGIAVVGLDVVGDAEVGFCVVCAAGTGPGPP